MDSQVKILIERADTELVRAQKILIITEDSKIREELQIEPEKTFYSAVISHAYYSIFYAAKALLLTRNITTSSPDVHRKTYDTFKKEFIDTGILDLKLLEIYKRLVIRADALLDIFKDEKWKRATSLTKLFLRQTGSPQQNLLKTQMSLL